MQTKDFYNVDKELIKSKKIAFDYYKNNRNLNKLIHSTEDNFLKVKFQEWEKEFYTILLKEEKETLENQRSEILLSEKKSVDNINFNNFNKTKYTNSSSNNINKYKGINKSNNDFLYKTNSNLNDEKETYKGIYSFPLSNTINSYISNITSDNINSTIINNKNKKNKSELYLKETIDENVLDFDEMIDIEYPKHYDQKVIDPLLKELGMLLNENRELVKKGLDGRHKLSNDDFKLLLCALRIKKKHLNEVNTFSNEFKFDLKNVYCSDYTESDYLTNTFNDLKLSSNENRYFDYLNNINYAHESYKYEPETMIQNYINIDLEGIIK